MRSPVSARRSTNSAPYTEGKSDFLFRLNLPCQDDGLAQTCFFDDDGTNGTHRWRFLGSFALAAHEHDRQRYPRKG